MDAQIVVYKLLENEEEEVEPKELFRQAAETTRTHRVITLDSSHGNIVFNSLGTAVLEDSLDPTDFPKEHHPARLDVREWKETYPGEDPCGISHDILDWGYWMVNGAYEPPAHEWRQDIPS